MYINFQQTRVSSSVQTVHTNIFASCINLQLPIVILKKKTIILDMHHHKTYMYINFPQYRVNRSILTVHANVFTKQLQVA